jgi:hypothetical protein
MAAAPVTDLLSDILNGRQIDGSTIHALVRERRPEGLYLEYKRGQWLDAEKGQELRRYASGFANAEGGVLIIGIVGGEESQGVDKWSIEAPVCPDKSGWDSWLGRVLAEVATKTRVSWQVVSVDGKEAVVIAVNRAEALVRLYEKPKLVCYLRVGEHTVPIDETLFVDLALGRRAKPDLALENLTVHYSSDSGGPYVNVELVLHNQGLLWVPDVRVAWIGYAIKGTRASSSLVRQVELRPVSETSPVPTVGVLNFLDAASNGWRSPLDGKPQEVRPFENKRFATKIDGLPTVGRDVPCAWYGAVFVVPKNGSPIWAQLAVRKETGTAEFSEGWAVNPGTRPLVAWFEGGSVPSREAVFGNSSDGTGRTFNSSAR